MEKKIKVLITSGIFPPEIGGPARVIEQLSDELVRNGFRVMVLTFGKADSKPRSYPVVRAKGKSDFFWKMLFLARRADIIYTFDLYTAGFCSWLTGKIFRKKLIVRFAGDSAWELAVNKGRTTDDIITFQNKDYGLCVAWHKLIRGLILKGADQVIAVSRFMKDLAVRMGVPGEKITVIYNSVDFVEYDDLDGRTRILHEKLGLREEKIIMTAGRLVPWKGMDGLIKLMKGLKDGLGLWKLIVVGEGPDRGWLEKIVEDEGVARKVIFTGQVPMAEAISYYNLADVFVLNSQYEGLSHVLLEVLSLSKPIIASNCGGNPEVIEDGKNGLLIEYNNVEQLKLAIKRVLTEPYWQSVEHKQACQESLKKFSWSENLKKTIELLNSFSHAE